MAKNAAGGHKSGKKNRKHKRHLLRSPSHKRYEAENRCEKNKIKKQKRHRDNNPNDKTVLGTVPDYRNRKLKPEEQQELQRQHQWKAYLKGHI
jgi:hypothetical protein